MNPDLFTRSDELLVYYMENIYLSIKKEMGINAYFTFKVINFDVVFEYDKVREILSKHLETAINKSVKLTFKKFPVKYKLTNLKTYSKIY